MESDGEEENAGNENYNEYQPTTKNQSEMEFFLSQMFYRKEVVQNLLETAVKNMESSE